MDIRTAFSDIQKRATARRNAIYESKKKTTKSKKETTQAGSGKLQGLATLKNTLGTQYLKT
jgi:hypothetical protein